jgi:amino acid adenylation domain-containing protein
VTSPEQTPDRRELLARSLVQIKHLRAQLDRERARQREPIAIIGVGCRLPGAVNTANQLLVQLRAGFDAITEIPERCWRLDQWYDAERDAAGKMYARRGAFLDNVESFDAALFGISPREAAAIDPQQRLFLESSWQALEAAGIAPDSLAGSDTGVYAGVSTGDYATRQFQGREAAELDPYFLSGNVSSFVAGRVSYTLGLQGPSMVVDTACSSSLVAVHLAVSSLRRGEASLALAGGVNMILSPEWNVVLSRARMLAPDGHCKAFDARADGYVRGEGCAVVVLEPLALAQRKGRHILAVIRGSAVNQDGRASGITVPNGGAQQKVVEAALADAGIEPRQVGYVEAHGTGTALGDPIEIRSLAAVYGRDRGSDAPLQIGSIKTNIGHLEAAAGIAGLLKATLAVAHGELFPHLHLHQVNPDIDLAAIPASIPTRSTRWDCDVRRAGVSSFGASGTNAHVIVEQYVAPEDADQEAHRGTDETGAASNGAASVLLLSARSEAALRAMAKDWADWLPGIRPGQWPAACALAAHGRARLDERLAVVADDPAVASSRLATFAAGEPAVVARGRARGRAPKVAFLFSGQGSQVLGMGQRMAACYPVFRRAFERCEDIVRPLLPRPLGEVIAGGPEPGLLDRTLYTQPAVFAIGWSLAELWCSWGVRPAAVLGHSLGEYVAATVAGVFELEDALALVVARARMMDELPGDGGMVSLMASEQRARTLLTALPQDRSQTLSIAAINGPESVVVSGLCPALDELARRAADAGVKARRLSISHGIHSPQMDAMLDPFEGELRQHSLRAPELPLVSNLHGGFAGPEVTTTEYWRRHIREPVRFAQGLGSLVESGHAVLVELGATPVLSSMAEGQVGGAALLPSLRKRRREDESLATTLAELVVRGVEPDWDAIGAQPSATLSPPTYSFQRERFWYTQSNPARPTHAPPAVETHSDLGHPLLGRRIDSPLATAEFQTLLDRERLAFLDHFVIDGVNVVNIGVYIEMLRAGLRQHGWAADVCIDELSIERAFVLDAAAPLIHLVLHDQGASDGALAFSLHSRARSGDTWRQHCSGRVRPGDQASAAFALHVRERAAEQMSGAHFYQHLWRRAIHLGPSGRWVTAVYRSEPDALCELRPLDDHERGDAPGLHPGIIDAAFQCAYALLPNSAPTDAAYMLVGCARMRIHGAAHPRWCHVHRRRFDVASGSLSVDLVLADDRCRPVVEIEGALLKYASGEILRSHLAQHDRTGAPPPDTSSASATSPAPADQPRLANALRNAPEDARLDLLITKLARHTGPVLGYDPDRLDVEASLLDLGVDSLMAVELKRRFEHLTGLSIALVDLLEGPSLVQLSARLLPGLVVSAPHQPATPAAASRPSTTGPDSEPGAGSGAGGEAGFDTIVPAPADVHEPFPLTDLQQAYLIGRRHDFELGNVSTYFFVEVDLENLDVQRLEEAWNRLVARHDMLRAVFMADGRQRILAEVPRYCFDVQDLRELDADARTAYLDAISDQSRARVFRGDTWPLFEVRATRIDDRRTRLHIGVEALIVDAWSTSLLFREWAALYARRSLPPPPELSFRDYMLAVDRLRRSPLHARALAYWQERVPTLPPAPELPLAISPQALTRPTFVHRSGRLPVPTWTRFRDRARHAKVTPSVALCAAYASVIGAWSCARHFTLNLLYFNRLPLHPQVREVAANFSSTLLLEIDLRGGATFEQIAQTIQRQLAADLDHSLVSGVEVLRMLNRQRSAGQGAVAPVTMPVVFASTISLGGSNQDDSGFGLTCHLLSMGDGGDEVHSSIRTPQVWLDHQVIEEGGSLIFNWDAVDTLFPGGMIDAMFAAYRQLLERLADAPEAWTAQVNRGLVPAAELDARRLRNATKIERAPTLLHAGFMARARQCAGDPAVITAERTLSYGELDRRSEALARELLHAGIDPGELVAVVMVKGWEQIVAVLAIHKAGGAYLPIDPSLPRERIHYLLAHASVSRAITTSAIDSALSWPSGLPRSLVDGGDAAPQIDDSQRLEPRQAPDTLAYVIYTSGSTGLPKGVAITHAMAMNTITDINERFAVGPDDRCFAISSLSFDLSVYDIFGLLGAGGALVIPEGAAIREPAAWAALVRDQRVTIWNSVPALAQMLTERVAATRQNFGPGLRLVMMSGDWIPVTLPDAIRALCPDIAIVSLGGATEASIWSIYYPVGEVDPAWSSIPYGRPLSNQCCLVLDDDLEPRPTWVPGELFIAGDGVALGYWNDPERTAERFFEHPRTGERLYRTGDMGRYLPDLDIEFLGRTDNQVKVQGYRIELGEIDAALARLPQLRAGIAAVIGERTQSKTLVAYVVPDDPDAFDIAEVRAQLDDILPPYMVPTSFFALDKLPLNANGKIDRKALPSPRELESGPRVREYVAPRDELERRLAAIWAELFKLDDVGVTDDFVVDLGGQSFLAMRLMARVHDEFGVELELASLFRQGTIAAQAQLIRDGCSGRSWSPLVEMQSGIESPLLLVHPVGGNVLCYAELSRGLARRPVYGLQAYGIASGQVPLTTIESMAKRYVRAARDAGLSSPWRIGGWSLGGVVAYEMACQLAELGDKVEYVVLIDSQLELLDGGQPRTDELLLPAFVHDLARTSGRWVELGGAERRTDGRFALESIHAKLVRERVIPETLGSDAFTRLWSVYRAGITALDRYQPRPMPDAVDRLLVLDAADELPRLLRSQWRELAAARHYAERIPGDHYTLLRPPHRDALIDAIARHLDAPPQKPR